MKQLTKANLANTFRKRLPKTVQIAAGIFTDVGVQYSGLACFLSEKLDRRLYR